MRSIRNTLPYHSEEYSARITAGLLVLHAFIFTACSTKTSDETQAAQQSMVIQGDAIDAPAVPATPPNEARDAQKPEDMPAQNSNAGAKNFVAPRPSGSNSGAKSTSSITAMASGATETASSRSPSTVKEQLPAATPENKKTAAESLPATASPAATSAPQAGASLATFTAVNSSQYQ